MLFHVGYVAPWSGRFYSLWDTGYAKVHIPIIASVSEHQPTTWVSFFFDLHILICVFPAGAWFVIKEINDERVFSEFSTFASFSFILIGYNSKQIAAVLTAKGHVAIATYRISLSISTALWIFLCTYSGLGLCPLKIAPSPEGSGSHLIRGNLDPSISKLHLDRFRHCRTHGRDQQIDTDRDQQIDTQIILHL